MRFASRYPLVLLVPLSALALGIASAYAAGLAGSWSYIHGAKTVAVFAGAVLGIALAITAVVGHRQGVSGLLILPVVVLVVGFVTTRQEIAPVVGSPGKVTTAFEAAEFALLAVLCCVCALGFLVLLPRFWRARMAFRAPGRALHITRAPDWREASSEPIPLYEWQHFAEARDDLAPYEPRDREAGEEGLSSLDEPGGTSDGKAARRLAVRERQLRASRDLIATRPDLVVRNPDLAQFLPPGLVKTFAYDRGDGSRMYLTWFSGEIVIAGVGRDVAGDVARVQPIAWALGARLVDEDGRVYDHV